jgi:hypothetical protein
VVRRGWLAAATNIQHDHAEFGGIGAACRARSRDRAWAAPIIDPLLKDGKLLPLFRNRTIGKEACYLVRPRGSQSVVARVIKETKQGSQDEIQQQAELSWGAVRRRHEQESERAESMTCGISELERLGGPAR